MIDVYQLAIGLMVGGFAAWKATHLAMSVRSSVDSVKELSGRIDAFGPKLEALQFEIRELNKQNADAVRSISRSANEFERCLESFRALVEPAQAPVNEVPPSFSDLTYSFQRIQKDLLDQGLDPETAKYRAAEYELDRIASGEPSDISMSL